MKCRFEKEILLVGVNHDELPIHYKEHIRGCVSCKKQFTRYSELKSTLQHDLSPVMQKSSVWGTIRNLIVNEIIPSERFAKQFSLVWCSLLAVFVAGMFIAQNGSGVKVLNQNTVKEIYKVNEDFLPVVLHDRNMEQIMMHIILYG